MTDDVDHALTALIHAVDAATHGDFAPLFGDRQDEWFAFARFEAERGTEGAFVHIPVDSWSLWMAWTFDGDTMEMDGVYIPPEDADDAHDRPDEHLTWPVFRLDQRR